jgi:hypothetical protein
VVVTGSALRLKWAALSSNAAPSIGLLHTEQRVILKDGRTLGFAEYGDRNGEAVLGFRGWPSCRIEARNYEEAGKKL